MINTDAKEVKILLNSNPIEDETLNTDFLDNFPKDIPFPEAQILQTHLESLFNEDNASIK